MLFKPLRAPIAVHKMKMLSACKTRSSHGFFSCFRYCSAMPESMSRYRLDTYSNEKQRQQSTKLPQSPSNPIHNITSAGHVLPMVPEKTTPLQLLKEFKSLNGHAFKGAFIAARLDKNIVWDLTRPLPDATKMTEIDYLTYDKKTQLHFYNNFVYLDSMMYKGSMSFGIQRLIF